jgi:RNA polymerase sigma-70 factor (ECF subfamily)
LTKDAAYEELTKLISKYQHSLVQVAFRITIDYEAAKDIVQDACLSIMENVNQFKGNSTFKTYLYRIVINRSIDFLRKAKRSRNLLEIISREHDSNYLQYDHVEYRDISRRLFAAIPYSFRIPLILAEVEDMKYEEIAEVLKISINTVRTRIFRCREKLRKEFSKLEMVQ